MMQRGLTLIELMIVCGILCTLGASFVLFALDYNKAYMKNNAWAELCAKVLKLQSHLRMDVEKVGGNIKWVQIEEEYGAKNALPAPMYFRVYDWGIIEEGNVSAEDFSKIRMLFEVVDKNGNSADGGEELRFASCTFPEGENFIIKYYKEGERLLKQITWIDPDSGQSVKEESETIFKDSLSDIRFDAQAGARVLQIRGRLQNEKQNLLHSFAFALKISGENGVIKKVSE